MENVRQCLASKWSKGAIKKEPRTDNIFKVQHYLELSICVNLDRVYARQRGGDLKKYTTKDLQIIKHRYRNDSYTQMTKEKFTEITSMFGAKVEHVKVYEGNSFILQSILQYCKNIKRIELGNCEGSLMLQDFRNLTELKVPGIRMCANAFRNLLIKNPSIESLEYDCWWYENDLMDLLEILPKLNSLRLHNVLGSFYKNLDKNKLFQDLLRSKVLTKFSFQSQENCNKLLTGLTQKLNLEELHVTMAGKQAKRSPESMTFPPRIKRIQLSGMEISCSALLSIVKQLTSLEEFHLGRADKPVRYYPWLYNSEMLSQLADKLKTEFGQRTLNIFFWDNETNDIDPHKYKSDQLAVLNTWLANDKAKPQHILVDCESSDCWYTPH